MIKFLKMFGNLSQQWGQFILVIYTFCWSNPPAILEKLLLLGKKLLSFLHKDALIIHLIELYGLVLKSTIGYDNFFFTIFYL